MSVRRRLFDMMRAAGLTPKKLAHRVKLSSTVVSGVFDGLGPLTPDLHKLLVDAIKQKPPPQLRKSGRRNITAETGLTPQQRYELRKKRSS